MCGKVCPKIYLSVTIRLWGNIKCILQFNAYFQKCLSLKQQRQVREPDGSSFPLRERGCPM